MAMADRGKLEAALQAARETVAGLEAKRARAEREAERLRAAKGPKLAALSTDDRAGQRHLREMNTKIAAQELLVGDYAAAIEQAAQRVEAIEREIENAGDIERAEALAERHGELLEADRACDALMGQLAEAFRRRLAVITAAERLMDRATLSRHELDGLRSDFGWSAKTKGPGTRAARSAGLADYLDLPYVGKPVPLSAMAYPHLERLILALRNGGQREAA